MGYNGDIENISLDGYMFCGKEEHIPVSSLREVLTDYMEGHHIDHFEMGYQDGGKIWRGNSGHAPVGVMRR